MQHLVHAEHLLLPHSASCTSTMTCRQSRDVMLRPTVAATCLAHHWKMGVTPALVPRLFPKLSLSTYGYCSVGTAVC
jgi:hypothetical protein